MKKLTDLAQRMLDRLNREGTIYWASTRTQETKALNRLVKKGMADVVWNTPPFENTYWSPK